MKSAKLYTSPLEYLILLNNMNQKTLQHVYKTYETQEYYKRYLYQMGCREDRRKNDEHRIIKITSKANSVVISAGQTLVIANLTAQIQPVTFSPVSMSYGQSLLKLRVVSNSQSRFNRQNKSQRAIQQFILKQINWAAIEDQLVGSDINNGKTYGYKGQLNIRVLGDDGGVEEYGLLSVQLLLWTAKFKKFRIAKDKIQLGEYYKLTVEQLLFPLKYSYLVGTCLTDPTLSQEQNCEFYVTVLKNLRKRQSTPTVLHHFRKSYGKMTEDLLKNIMSQWQRDLEYITNSYQKMLQDLQTNGQTMLYSKSV